MNKIIRVLFLIHDLGPGGAEKVLIRLVRQLDRAKFDITVKSLFGGGVNEQLLPPDVHYQAVFPRMIPGNSHWMKLLTPRQLHRLCVKERYDVEIAFLEGPSARIISGCDCPGTRLISWIHYGIESQEALAAPFRSLREAQSCYGRMDRLVFVSEGARNAFLAVCSDGGNSTVLRNVCNSDSVRRAALAPVPAARFSPETVNLVSVGKLVAAKRPDRLLRILEQLRRAGYPVHLYLLGDGPLRRKLEAYARKHRLQDSVTFFGYQTNPYPYMARCDLLVCASRGEGFSTAAVEALILGVPVCTVEVCGMEEVLGGKDRCGLITENSEEALYAGIRTLLEDPVRRARCRQEAAERGAAIHDRDAVAAAERLLLSL